jgi:NAD(P)-dependent dehydrogenase (short-subunit alcohol dehydrogenase family)
MVTGGAKGIGRGIVDCFAGQTTVNPIVYSLDTDVASGIEQAAQAAQAFPETTIRFIETDVSCAVSCAAAVQQVLEEEGR